MGAPAQHPWRWLLGGLLLGFGVMILMWSRRDPSLLPQSHSEADPEAVMLNAVLRRYVADREQHRHFDPDLTYHVRLYRRDWSAMIPVDQASLDQLRNRGVHLAGDDASGDFPALVVRIAEADAAGAVVWAGRQVDLSSGGALVYRVSTEASGLTVAPTGAQVPLRFRD